MLLIEARRVCYVSNTLAGEVGIEVTLGAPAPGSPRRA